VEKYVLQKTINKRERKRKNKKNRKNKNKQKTKVAVFGKNENKIVYICYVHMCIK